MEHPKSKSTKPSLRGHGTPCRLTVIANFVYLEIVFSGATKGVEAGAQDGEQSEGAEEEAAFQRIRQGCGEHCSMIHPGNFVIRRSLLPGQISLEPELLTIVDMVDYSTSWLS